MGKVLRVLVIILLLLSAGAFALGFMLFSKREMLKGRTLKMEKAIKDMDAFIEAEPGILEAKPADPNRDISPCTPELLTSPEMSDFWKNYNYDLEVQEPGSMVDSARNADQLMQYYQIDPLTGKASVDGMGKKVTKGKGTLQEILDKMVSSAEAQYERLNATRQQLLTLRKEYVSAVEELNEKKQKLRETLATVVDRDNTISELSEKIRGLEGRISALETEKKALEDQIAELRRDVAKLNDTIVAKDREITSLKSENESLRKKAAGDKESIMGKDDWSGIEAGEKGKVTSVNPKWNFAVAELSDGFIKELLGDDFSREFRPVTLFIKRPGVNGAFVSKVKLLQLKKDQKLCIADILTNWQQLPVQEGDILFR